MKRTVSIITEKRALKIIAVMKVRILATSLVNSLILKASSRALRATCININNLQTDRKRAIISSKDLLASNYS